MAHVQSSHPGPYLLPPCPLCGAHPVVQCHHEYTLIRKHLSSLTQFLVSAASVKGTVCDTANAHLLLLLLVRPRSTFCTESFSGGSCHLCSVGSQSDSLTLPSRAWRLPLAVTFSQCCGVCLPRPLVHRKEGVFGGGF